MLCLDDQLPLYSIFILFLIITAAFITELFPCRLRQLLRDNMYLKHFYAYLTMVFFVVMTAPAKYDVNEVIYKSFIVYIIFIFAIKTDYRFFVGIIFVIGIMYILILQKYEVEEKIKLTKDEVVKIELSNKRDKLIIVNNILFILSLILIIIGFLLYYYEKKLQYNKDFNFFTFLFGKPKCSHKGKLINLHIMN